MEEMKDSSRRVNPFLMAAAAVSLLFFARQSYRLLRPGQQRPRYKSASKRPQIARWESEGGMVPEVRAVQSSEPTQH